MRSAFITGAGGFLGGHIARQLLEQGWEVTALLRPGGDGEPLRRAGLRVVEAPMDNATELALRIHDVTEGAVTLEALMRARTRNTDSNRTARIKHGKQLMKRGAAIIQAAAK